jgi:hypothetical protein
MPAMTDKPNRFPWSRDKEIELARRYVAGEAVDAIAASFGCTTSALTTRISTLGIRRRKLATNCVGNGNAIFLTGSALRSAMPLPDDSFGEDLLAQLD